jgi:hypothetical protein
LPTGKPGLWIELGGDGLRVATRHDPRQRTTLRTATVFGASSQWSIVDMGRDIARMGALFTPNGAAAFFAPPTSELHNAHMPLDALWGDTAADEFRERLLVETTPAARWERLTPRDRAPAQGTPYRSYGTLYGRIRDARFLCEQHTW